MIKRFENYAEFASEMQTEFSRTSNERLVHFIALVGGLNQGCGCTRAARTQQASMEYRAIGEYLTEDNVNLLKNKWQGHKLEFAEAGELFFVIEP